MTNDIRQLRLFIMFENGQVKPKKPHRITHQESSKAMKFFCLGPLEIIVAFRVRFDHEPPCRFRTSFFHFLERRDKSNSKGVKVSWNPGRNVVWHAFFNAQSIQWEAIRFRDESQQKPVELFKGYQLSSATGYEWCLTDRWLKMCRSSKGE